MPDSSDKSKKQKETLDLIDDSANKLSRRERQRQDAPKVKTVDDQKKDALDIFEEEDGERKTSLIRKKSGGEKKLPVISKLIDQKDDEFSLNKSVAAPSGADEGVDAAGDNDAEGSSGEKSGNIITIKPPIIVSDLADLMELKPFQLMADLIKLEVFVAPHQAIDTFMGHVDHGKTSLLDFIRKSRVTSGEAGGITQHIGAYRVEHGDRPISFIDTPGHSIFTEMRARGADVTDIVVLVVAADDGIMPQTVEAIELAKKAGKTIIVAINKCDTQGADPTRVKTQLMEHSLQPVDFGGDIECVEVSATTGQGMDELIDLMALQAEVLELKANPRANARASVVEASVQAGKGPTATVMVQAGTLKVGVPFICGPFAGKVKTMLNDLGEQVKEAGPATPVEIIGFAELPHVGDELVQMKNERAAKKLSEERIEEKRETRLVRPKKSRMEDLMSMVEGDNTIQLKIILKGDVQGSVQAIENAINEIKSDKVEPLFIKAAAGAITENDILMASSSDAVVLGFNTKVESNAVRAAKSEGVQIKLFSIVYELIDTVEEAMLGLLDPLTRETIIGHAEVKQVFKVRHGRAAGCVATDGKIARNAHARVLRGKVPVFDGKMSTLRRHKDEVDEVKQGIECGIRLGDFDEYEEGDIIECYVLDKVAQTL